MEMFRVPLSAPAGVGPGAGIGSLVADWVVDPIFVAGVGPKAVAVLGSW